MASQRYVGTETEFGIQVVGGEAEVNPVLASSMVVSAYRGPRDIRWDHTDEHPLRDARGYEVDAHEPPTDDELGLANTVLTNGARFYVDHAHPEYSSPEVSNARDAVVWDKAGERILEDAAARATATLPRGRVLVHKNNTDGKGAAYGTHENYLVPRDVPFGMLVRHLTPLFVTRCVYGGAGRLGNEFGLPDVPFQLTQRADFFEVEVGLETTLKRPIINTRDEPHADPDLYRRLHVINGDATLCEVATFLRVGTTMLVLDMIEDEVLPEPLRIQEPVRAFHAVSHDLTQRQTLLLDDGRRVTPLEVQWHYLEHARKYVEETGRDDAVTADVLAWWERVLTTAERDPRELAGVVDWATKLQVLEQYRDRDGLEWTDAKLRMIDLQYHDVRRDKGLYNRLEARGKVERLVSDDEVLRAMTTPPEDTRAWFRGRCLDRFREQIVAAGWDALIFDVGRDALQRVPMMEPGRGTRATVGALLEEVADARELLDRLTG